jgi:hypothetical protein
MITAMTKIYLDEPKSCENDASSMEYRCSRDPSTLTSCGLSSICRDRIVTKSCGPARLSKWRSSGGFCGCQWILERAWRWNTKESQCIAIRSMALVTLQANISNSPFIISVSECVKFRLNLYRESSRLQHTSTAQKHTIRI